MRHTKSRPLRGVQVALSGVKSCPATPSLFCGVACVQQALVGLTRVSIAPCRDPLTPSASVPVLAVLVLVLFTLFDLVSFYKPFTPARLNPCTSSAATPENALARVRFLVLLP